MKTILITGATDGLGKAVAIDLAKKGHKLLLHGRNQERGKALCAELGQYTESENIRYYNADFLDLAQIKRFCKEILGNEERLDVLINNAGLGIESTRRESKDRNEALWQVNYLGTYIPTKLLKPLLSKSSPARIVNVASAGQAPVNFDDINQEQMWTGHQGYCQSKLAQIMLGMALAPEYEKEGITINSLHPASMMPTKIVKSPIDSVAEGVEATVRLAVGKSVEGVTGKYWFKTVDQRASGQAYDEGAQTELINISKKMTGIE